MGARTRTTRPEAGRIDSDTTQAPGPPPPPDTTGITQRRLIECPTSTATSSSLITILGGTVAAAGTSISLPAGSLIASTLINVTVPASTYMEVDITANSLPVFVFAKTVTVTIDYSALPTERDSGENVDRLAHQPRRRR